MPYIAKPSPCFLDSFEFYKVIGSRKVYRNNGLYYSWDELHGEIEVFDKRGFHLGALHPINGDKIKKAVKGRRLNVQ